MIPLGKLSELRAEQDRQLSALTRASGRRRFLPPAARGRSSRVLLALSAATLFVWLGWRGLPSRALTFTVEEREHGREGASWVSAPLESHRAIQFSEGSQVVLEPGARLRVAETTEQGAHLMVEQGEIHATVVHRATSAWRVDVGPFRVQVVGTKFDVEWRPETETFRLSMKEGSVSVVGPTLGGARTLVAGETLRVDAQTGQFTLQTSPLPDNSGEESAAREATPDIPWTDGAGAQRPSRPATTATAHRSSSTAPETSLDPGAAGRRPRASSSFADLARRGMYRAALDSALREGYDELCQTSRADELLLLADTARHAGEEARASQAYQTLRRRFPGSDEAGASAFALGRAAFDQRRSFGEAARWFQLYQQEQPRGPFAREAAGRVIESERQAGDLPQARTASQLYLQRYPDGPHASLARSVLGTSH